MSPDKTRHAISSGDLTKLRLDILKVSKEVKGQLGFYMKHVESGREIAIDADKIFPLGSVFKIPLMVEVFRQVDAGLISLDEKVRLDTKNMCIGS